MSETATQAEVKEKRIQRKRSKGWTMPPNATYVGRPSVWGNPFPLSKFSPDESLTLYRKLLAGDWAYLYARGLRRVGERWAARIMGDLYKESWQMESVLSLLRGKDLACWCPLDQPCHADILLELANQ